MFIFSFTKFELEERFIISQKCRFESLILYDEIDKKNNDYQGLGVFCGYLNDRLPIVKSKTNIMYISFNSVETRSSKGFVGEISFTYGNKL